MASTDDGGLDSWAGLSEFWSVNLTEGAKKKERPCRRGRDVPRLQKHLAHWMERRPARAHRRLEAWNGPCPRHPSHARAGRRGRVPPPFLSLPLPPAGGGGRASRPAGNGKEARVGAGRHEPTTTLLAVGRAGARLLSRRPVRTDQAEAVRQL